MSTPEERFHAIAREAQELAAKCGPEYRGYLGDEGAQVITETHNGYWLHTGGGCMVGCIRVDERHVIGVSDECVCLYVAEGEDAVEQFENSEDPWLVSSNNERPA